MDPFPGHSTFHAKIQSNIVKPTPNTTKPPPISMSAFRRKYPYANFVKFYEDVDDNNRVGVFTNAGNLGSVSVTDPVYLKSSYAKDLTAKQKVVDDFWKKLDDTKKKLIKDRKLEAIHEAKSTWPKIWSVGKELRLSKSKHLTYPRHAKRQDVGDHHIIDTKFLSSGNLKDSFENFRLYVNDTDYFEAELPRIRASWSSGKKLTNDMYDIRQVPFDYKKEPYFAMIAGMYVASFVSGISIMNLTDPNTPNLIKSIARYHLYYQTRKFMKYPELLDRYQLSDCFHHIPVRYQDIVSTRKDDDGNYYALRTARELSNFDYIHFIAHDSEGISSNGQRLLQESIESYVYSVLGAQAKTRWSIVNRGAKSQQTQNAFRKIVEDTIIQKDDTVLISDMRTAIQDTYVILNMAICPGVILVPSDMVIQKKLIAGYNNVITTASESMMFGKNSKVNFVGLPKVYDKPIKKIPRRTESTTRALLNIPKPVNRTVLAATKPPVQPLSYVTDHQSDLLLIFGIIGLGSAILYGVILRKKT